ncbi:MAG: NYN domain-containing protein [Elusimicrobia bacterium]|nr:NYN domain-containing protein [Elusimicrobiota bacterium]
MPTEPAEKRTAVFVDGQNLFHSAREAFGHVYPNYDIKALAEAVCRIKGWKLIQTRFYTGIPDRRDNARWNRFWAAKLLAMSRSGVRVYTRRLRYRNKVVLLPKRPEFGDMAGKEYAFMAGEEKGIDVRIALDVIQMAHRKEYDVALIFSQDQDLSEAADEIRVIAREQDRWLRIASAFPSSPVYENLRGINKTDWIPIERETYDACLDRREYRAS